MASPIELQRRFIQRWGLTPEEQTCDLLELAGRDQEQAAYQLAELRAKKPRAPRRSEVSTGGTAAEIHTAGEISRFVAREVLPVVEGIRERLLGKKAPLTYREAVKLLKANEVKSGGCSLSFAGRRGVELYFNLDPGSPLAGLRTASYLLSYVCHWTEAEAARFILVGDPPMIPAVRATAHRINSQGAFRTPITITLLPYVSDRSVVTMIRSARRRLMGALKGPLPEVRRQAMADFVTALQRHKAWRGWPDAYARWKQDSPPEWRYSDWRSMQRSHTHEMAARSRAEQARALRGARYVDYLAARLDPPARRRGFQIERGRR
jgi:hypothetical protein